MMWPKRRRKASPAPAGAEPPARLGAADAADGEADGPTDEKTAGPGMRKRMSRKRKGLLALVTVLVVVGLVAGAPALQGLIFVKHSKYFILQVDYESVASDVNTLVNLGPRLTGSDAEGEAADYIATQFKGAGLTGVEVQQYSVTCYSVDNAYLALVPYARGMVPTPTKQVVEFQHKTDFAVGAYSGSRVYNRWTDDLDIVDVGNGSDSSSLWSTVKGKAVIVTNEAGLGNTHLYLEAWANGAKACVIHNVVIDAQLGFPAISYTMDAVDSAGHTIPLPDNYSGNAPDIPCLMVSKSAGDTIKSGIAAPAQSKLRMDIEVTIGSRPVRVVVGERRGYLHPDRIVMIGGHHDSVYLGPGAVDNAAGAAATVGLARAMGTLRPADTIRFATFGGEEEGLLGSYAYYKANADRLKGKLVMMLNIDMPNVDLARSNVLPMVVSDPRYVATLNEIRAEAYAELPALARYNVQISSGSLNSSSDMATFGLEGYKVASCWGSGSYEYHTPRDTAEHINPESFLVMGAVYGSFALYVAGGRA